MNEKLERLARAVLAQVRPHQNDRDDAFQIAYLAGLQATKSAQRNNKPTKSRYLFLAMQSAVYRHLKREKLPLDAAADTDVLAARQSDENSVDDREYLAAHIASLSSPQKDALELVYLRGVGIDETARRLKIKRNSVHARLYAAVRRLRSAGELSGDGRRDK